MICVAALIVFSILAIFSARYRSLAKEAWSCVFLKIRLRPCNSGLDRRVRLAATIPFMKRAPRLAKGIYRWFSVISAVFVIVTIVSFIYLAWGGYNYALYGNCNGPGSNGFCIFDPYGPGTSAVAQCTESPHAPDALQVPTDEALAGMKTFHPNATKSVVLFACYSCPYSREASPAVIDLIAKRPDVRFVLVDFPIPGHTNSILAATAGNCVYDEAPEQFLSYASSLYAANLSDGVPQFTDSRFASCVRLEHPRTNVGKALGVSLGIYGTPTYFINGKAYVGPLNERSLNTLIDRG